MSRQGSDKTRVDKSLVKMFNNNTNDLLHTARQSNTFVKIDIVSPVVLSFIIANLLK